MKASVYAAQAAKESRHWWFAGRRAVLRVLLEPVRAEISGRRVLALGCGPGAELEFLAGWGRVIGMDVGKEVLGGEPRSRGTTLVAGLGEALPFRAGRFGLVTMFDVLEHIAAEADALAEARRVLAPGGWLALTVPAMPWLWSEWDSRVHHHRRYTRRALVGRLRAGGFEIRRLTSFNLLLLPVIAAARKLPVLKSWGGEANGREFEAGSGGFWNPILSSVLRAEAGLLKVLDLPAGVSLAVLARRAA